MANESETRRNVGKRNTDTLANTLTPDPSASSTGANSENATVTEPAKTKTPRAPQKRVMHIFYKPTTDANGQPGVEIVNVLSDARKVIEYMDGNDLAAQGIKRYKHEVVSEPRGSKDEAGAE